MVRIELILRQSANADTLDADLLIFDENGYPSQFVDTLTPIPEELRQSIEQWREAFSVLVGVGRGLKIVGTGVTTVSCSESASAVRDGFSRWLKSQEGWQRLQDCISQYVSENKELQINIQTRDRNLRLLPWSEFFWESSPYAETSISLAREFQRRSNLRVKKQVRILAVLGNYRSDTLGSANPGFDQPIDVNFDSEQLEKTRVRGGYIETYKQPTIKELRASLRNPEGWHIFFFAGHSTSLQDSSIGSIVLNQDEPPLAVDELKVELLIAIENGLQVAIFNSCDGLGLANQLAALNLPQSIVMREPVPDEVAKDFLEQFLTAFSYNHSLFESVRRARRYLREKFDHQDQFPGASWLPTIVRNPAVSLPHWNDFIAESPVSWRWLMIIGITAWVVLDGLFLSLFFEFKELQSGGIPKYIYYAQLYPHIVLYPCLFFWVGYFTLYKAWCQIRRRPKLWRQMVIAFCIALIFLRIELTSDRIMLFELKSGAESVISVSAGQLRSIEQMPKQILDISGLIDAESETLTVRKDDLEMALENFQVVQTNGIALSELEKKDYYTFMFHGLAYDTWRGTGEFSTSRIFYALAFLGIIAVVLVSGVFWTEIKSKYVYNGTRFLRYIVATQLIILSWLPLRIYQNRVIKGLIFGEDTPVNGLDVLVYPVILILLGISIYRSWKFESSFFAGVATLLAVLGFIAVGVVNPTLVGITFGLRSNPATWVMWPVMFLVVIYMVHNDIFARHSTR
jgi:hypothetical protein